MKGRIHSFETFGTLDGPGIRFVAFLKGCPMRCLYCHNPDTWSSENAREMDGAEVFSEFRRYRNYYTNGGITISGGEPLAQIDFVIELLGLCKREGIHTAVDTSGAVFDPNDARFEALIQVCDLFLLDIKQMNKEKHLLLTGKENDRILEFARFLDDRGKKMWIRYVLVPGYTDDEEDLRALRSFISGLKHVEKVEVLPYHTLGVGKYKKLGIVYPLEGVLPPREKKIKEAEAILYGKSEC